MSHNSSVSGQRGSDIVRTVVKARRTAGNIVVSQSPNRIDSRPVAFHPKKTAERKHSVNTPYGVVREVELDIHENVQQELANLQLQPA